MKSFLFDNQENFHPFLFSGTSFPDERGNFSRFPFREIFEGFGVQDIFFTTSHANVARGIHFQKQDSGLRRIVTCVSGMARDILIDLRPDSKTLGSHVENILTPDSNTFVIIPQGFGHGFISLVDNTQILYVSDQVTSKDEEGGILLTSINIELPKDVLLSKFDNQLPPLDAYLLELKINSARVE